jgi:hypothetical protein
MEADVADELPDQSDLDAEQEVRSRMDARLAQIDLVAELEAAGMPYSELDENGQVITHYPSRPPTPRR